MANFFDSLINLSGNAIPLQVITSLFCLKYYIFFETKYQDKVWTIFVETGFPRFSSQIRCFSFWMNGCFSNQMTQNRKISSNFFIRDARNHQQSSVLSMYSKNGTISLEVKQVLWLMRSSTVLLMTATRSTSQALMLSMTDQCERCTA